MRKKVKIKDVPKTKADALFLAQKNSAIRYIEASLDHRRNNVDVELAVARLDAELGLTGDPKRAAKVAVETTVIQRLEEVLAVLRRAP